MKFLAFSLPEEIERAKFQKDFSTAKELIKWWLNRSIPEFLRKRLEIELLRIERLPITYSLSLDDALKEAKARINGFTDEEFYHYFNDGFIDYISLDGKILVEHRFVDNLGFLFPEIKNRLSESESVAKGRAFLEERIQSLIRGEKPKKWRVKARIYYFFPNPSNNKVKVWLPIPREVFPQFDVKILKTSHPNPVIAPPDALQRTVYMEGLDVDEFYVEFSYGIFEQFSDDLYKVLLEGKSRGISGDLESQFLREQLPHISFTPSIRLLASELADEKDDYFSKVRKVYDFVTLKVRYSYVRPYIFYDNISQFVLDNLKGDCGFQALLFITLCRCLGIPSRWQSGWYITPYGASLHDWSVAFFGDFGWRPVDLSFGGKKKDDIERRMFYLGNLDGFRMIANDEFMREFYPDTCFMRQDPYDNQVGEAEYEEEKAFGEHRIEVLEFKEA
ncbi:MAG: transglutaminase-like domain-containing protein [Candidatus Hydrothermia bacterium]